MAFKFDVKWTTVAGTTTVGVVLALTAYGVYYVSMHRRADETFYQASKRVCDEKCAGFLYSKPKTVDHKK